MTLLYVIYGLTALAVITPFLLALIFPHKITFGEIVASVVVSLLITILSVVIMRNSLSNTELLHGSVVSKAKERTSCEHSYRCNPVTSTDSNGNTTTVYSTCYEHSHDYNWVVKSTVGNYYINRIDSRGSREPPRFSSVVIGEPTTMESRYIDYVGNAKHSLFNFTDEERYIGTQRIPTYPRVFDYYRVGLVINEEEAVSSSMATELNQLILDQLKVLGAQKQVNVVVVFTNQQREFANAIQSLWNNGRKNDQVVVIGVGEEGISWAHSFGWSGNNMVNITIRDQLNELVGMDVGDISNIITNNISSYFNRTPMANYEYLANEIEVGFFTILFIIFLQLAGNALMAHIILTRY